MYSVSNVLPMPSLASLAVTVLDLVSLNCSYPDIIVHSSGERAQAIVKKCCMRCRTRPFHTNVHKLQLTWQSQLTNMLFSVLFNSKFVNLTFLDNSKLNLRRFNFLRSSFSSSALFLPHTDLPRPSSLHFLHDKVAKKNPHKMRFGFYFHPCFHFHNIWWAVCWFGLL